MKSSEESFCSHCSDSTLPAEESLIDDSSGIESSPAQSHCSNTKQRKQNLLKKFFQEPVVAGKLYAKTISYPGQLSCPFPISSYFKKYLKNISRAKFCENYSAYKSLVREIHSIIYVKLERNPTPKERKLIASGLVREYPVLGCGYPPHSALSEALRKRAHNQTSQLRRQLKLASAPKANAVAKQSDKVKKFEDDFENRGKFVTSLDGKIRSKDTFIKYPKFKNPDVCLTEMALLLKKSKNALVENAKIAWERIFENECDDLKGCCAVRILYSMVKKHCKNGKESYVIQISDLGQIAESRKEKNQLFILCAGSLENPGSVSIAIDCNSLVVLDGDDPLRWLMI